LKSTSEPPLPGRDPIPAQTLKAALELWGQAGEAHWIPVRGTSMLPLLRQGDQVLVAHGSRELRRGDIVVFQRPDGLIAHRVLRVQSHEGERTLRTKGDNVLGLDTPLSAGELVGKVLQVGRGKQALNLDTRLWRGVGAWVVLVMLAQAGIYHRLGSGSADGVAKLIYYLSLGILRVNGLCLRATLALFGKWRSLAKL
jgi:signal peptidase I